MKRIPEMVIWEGYGAKKIDLLKTINTDHSTGSCTNGFLMRKVGQKGNTKQSAYSTSTQGNDQHSLLGYESLIGIKQLLDVS